MGYTSSKRLRTPALEEREREKGERERRERKRREREKREREREKETLKLNIYLTQDDLETKEFLN